MSVGTVLLAEDEPDLREVLARVLGSHGFDVSVAADGTEALAALQDGNYDAVVTDLLMPGADGLTVLRRVREIAPQTLVLLLTGYGSVETAVTALREGVADYVQKPVRLAELAERLRCLLERRELAWESRALRLHMSASPDLPTLLIGRSAAMQRILSIATQVAPTDCTVLITGESGVGKEVVARAIHQLSRRPGKLFLPVNCGAIPESLLESELFGHAKGAFTGADGAQEGLFHRARGGTIFLDEIGEVPFHLQVKLLRAIEEKEILPIGTSTPISVQVRIIAASNRDLRKAVEEKSFREDLYYRLKVVAIDVPPLRDRREDIPPLVEYLIQRHNLRLKRSYKGVDNPTMKLLMSLPWEGNVRELDHVIEHGMITGDGEWVRIPDLPPGAAQDVIALSDGDNLAEAIRHFEKSFIQNVLQRMGGDRRKAAAHLGIDLSTLYRKIRDLRIETS